MKRLDPKEVRRRLDAESVRVDGVKSAAEVPFECGSAIPSAPGRGAFVMFTPRETVITEAGSVRVIRSGYKARNAIRSADAFDVMQATAGRSRRNRQKPAAVLFTPSQIKAGRDYGALFERHEAAGVKCSSLEAQGGAGAGGSFVDAVLRDGRRLEAMRRAIGDGHAMEPKRSACHADRGRRAIPIRELVHLVCVGGLTLGRVLERFGWSANMRNREALRAPFCAALDRMYDADRR